MNFEGIILLCPTGKNIRASQIPPPPLEVQIQLPTTAVCKTQSGDKAGLPNDHLLN